MVSYTGKPYLTYTSNVPVWQLDGTTVTALGANLKVPIERVPGTPIVVKYVYSQPSVQNGLGGRILFYLDLLPVGHGDSYVATSGRWWVNPLVAGVNISMTTDNMEVPPELLDGRASSVDLSLVFGRQGDHILDSSDSDCYLIKVIFEYWAYQ